MTARCTAHLAVIAGALLVGACAEYSPKPIGEGAGAKYLSGETLDRLRVDAAGLGATRFRNQTVLINADGSMNALGAASLALVANPALRAARSRAGVARAQLLAAGILPNPQLSANVDVPAFGSTEGTTTGAGLGLTWEVTSLLTLDANKRAAAAQASAVDLEIAWQEWQIAMAARLSATRRTWLDRRLADSKATETAAREFAKHLAEAVNRGWATSIDGAAADAAVEKAAQTRLTIEAQIEGERLALCRAIGLAPGIAVRVIEDSAPATAPPPLADLETLIDVNRLDLIALRKGYESQEEKLRAAVKSQFPKIGLGFTPARDTSNVGTLGFGITLDLPIFDRGQGRIAIETATREQLYEEYMARRFEASADAAKALSDLESVRAQRGQAEEVVARLEVLSSALSTALDQGRADAVSVFQVRQQLSDARESLGALRQQSDELRIAIDIVTGCLQYPENP